MTEEIQAAVQKALQALVELHTTLENDGYDDECFELQNQIINIEEMAMSIGAFEEI